MQSAKSSYALSQYNIRPASSHICCDSNIAAHLPVAPLMLLTGLDYNLGLASMLFCIEYFMLDAESPGQGIADSLALFDTDCTDQHRPSRPVYLVNFLRNGVEFLADALVYRIFLVISYAGLVRRHNYNIKLVDIHEFTGLGRRCSRHTRKLSVQLKEVLQRYRRQRLCFFFYLHTLFCFHGLVQPVRPLPAVHKSSGKLIDYDHLAFHYNVVFLFLESHVRPKRLLQEVRPFQVRTCKERPDSRNLLRRRHSLMRQVNSLAVILDFIIFCCLLQPRLGAFKLFLALLNYLLGLLDPVIVFGFFGFTEFTFGIGDSPLFGIDFLFQAVVSALQAYQLSSNLLSLFVPRHIIEGRPGYNQRRPRFINQNRVHFVD